MASFPWIVGTLLFLLLLLAAARIALFARERWWRPAPKPPAPTPKPQPKIIPAGSPLQPSPASTPTPAPAAPKEPKKPPQPAKPSPLQLSFRDRPDLKASDFVRNGAQSDFGEMLTNLILAQDGWKKLPSKFVNGSGIGGLFAREVRGGGGFEILAVETRTNNAVFDAAALSDVKLARDLGELYDAGAIGKAMVDELIRGLTNGAPFFRKELWRHDLGSGVTTITPFAQGEAKAGSARSYARLMAAAHMSLTQMDRDATYVGQKGIDQDDA
jgi:hypothetical protein